MAQKVHIVLEDDLSGGEAAGTITFALEGTSYEIDLSEANAAKLRKDLAPWIAHARKAPGSRRGTVSGRKSKSATSATDIRQWARENGFDVSARGRVPAEVRQAYERAH